MNLYGRENSMCSGNHFIFFLTIRILYFSTFLHLDKAVSLVPAKCDVNRSDEYYFWAGVTCSLCSPPTLSLSICQLDETRVASKTSW